MLKLYNRERSGNCYKARLMLSLLGLEYEKVPVHREGKGRNTLPPDFEKLNPLRQLPVLVADGKPYWGTIAILVYRQGNTVEGVGCRMTPRARPK